MEHTEQCRRAFAEAQHAREAWATQWPNHCETCEGIGGQAYRYDPSPAGVALSSGYYLEWDLCPDCIEQGKCPRCGAMVWSVDDINPPEGPCPKCGWFGDDPDSVMMPWPECFCWVDDSVPEA